MNFFLKYKQTQMCSGAVANKTNLFIKNHEKHWTIYISVAFYPSTFVYYRFPTKIQFL